MKKALTFLTVAVLAATTQAATVTWKSGTITTPDGQANANTRKVTAMLYLIDSSTYSTLDLSTEANQQAALQTYLAKTADATGASNKNGLANVTTTIDDANKGIANSQYAVLIYQYGTGDSAVYKVGKGTDYLNDMGIAEGTASDLASQSGWVTKSSGGQDPIPEPTTVALLALGLAAVGLKRKVA